MSVSTAASARQSAGATSRPLRPSVMSSASPPIRVPTTGVPAACASIATVGPPSRHAEGQHSTSRFDR